MQTIAIIDYGSGNLRSAVKAFERAAADNGIDARIVLTNDPERVRVADRIVLPGVGAYADCRSGLDAVPGMVEALRDADIGFRLKKVLAGLLAFASPTNKNLFKALRELEDVVDRDGEAIVKGRVIATTWTEPGEDPAILERRRSYLMSGMMTWGEAVMTDAPHNPLRALCETVAGMTVQAEVPPGSIAPLGDLAALLPFHRTAGIFKQGQSMLVTPDGKPVPYEALSAEQLFWLTLIYATPGSGKSVLMNRLNVEFAAFSAGAALPFLAVIDVGVSSSGFIELVRNALPAERQVDMPAELKLLRRENEALRQEREFLKRATAFFAKEGSR